MFRLSMYEYMFFCCKGLMSQINVEQLHRNALTTCQQLFQRLKTMLMYFCCSERLAVNEKNEPSMLISAKYYTE